VEKHEEVERSIIKKYRKEIWKRFISGVNAYQLVSEGDKIAVCISGGKDSMLMAKCLQELQKHGIYRFGLEFLVMDPGYNEINRQRIVDNAALLDIPVTIFETSIFDVVAKTDRSPCYLCAKMRRGYLYSRAQALGCNKIALGHHFDDVIETILMSMLYGAEIKTMMPKLHSTNYEGMELIRPMYMVREADIIAWKRYNSLSFIQCACRFTENCVLGDNGGTSKRQEMKELIKRLRQTNPNIDISIFNSVHNVNLKTIIGWHDGTVGHSFLDGYSDTCPASQDADDDG
jgi:tRNA 2-thiocytidine biosynthesis protein TtcA